MFLNAPLSTTVQNCMSFSYCIRERKTHIFWILASTRVLIYWNFNSLAPGRCSCIPELIIFKVKSKMDEVCEFVNAGRPSWWLKNIGSMAWCHLAYPRPLCSARTNWRRTLCLGAICHQAITWANIDPDLSRHMASLGHNEVTLYLHTCFDEI